MTGLIHPRMERLEVPGNMPEILRSLTPAELAAVIAFAALLLRDAVHQ